MAQLESSNTSYYDNTAYEDETVIYFPILIYSNKFIKLFLLFSI